MNYQKISSVIKYCPMLFIVVGILLRLLVAFYQPLAFDEIASLFFSQTFSYMDLVRSGPEVIHPPLYYITIKFFFALIPHVAFLRLLHVAIFGLTLLLIYKLTKLIGPQKRFQWLILALFSISPYFLLLTYWLRMYAMGVLFTFAAIYTLLLYLRNKTLKHFFVFFVLQLMGIYTVYGFIFIIATLWCILFIDYLKTRLRFLALFLQSVLLIDVIVALAYFITYNGKEVTNHLVWLRPPQLQELARMTAVLFGFDNLFNQAMFFGSSYDSWPILILVLFTCIVGLGVWLLKNLNMRSMTPNTTLYLLVFVEIQLIIFVAMFVISNIYPTSFFHVRQMFGVAIALHMLIFYAIVKLVNKYKLIGLITIVLVTGTMLVRLVNFLPGHILYYDHIIDFNTDQVAPPKFGLYPDIMLSYYKCGATSFTNIVEKCQEHDVTMVKGLETANQISSTTEYNLVISDAYRGIFTEAYITKYCQPDINQVNLLKCQSK